jgi:predicted nicotinamide N-methyase
LGLGEGTGLLGIAAAKVMSWRLTLTDLPSIIDNLQRNVHYNCGESVAVKDLDWMDPPEDIHIQQGSFEVIIASDLFYDPHHPKMVVTMLERYLKRDPEARVVLEFPLRTSHEAEVLDFTKRMEKSFVLEASGEEIGRDDWDTGIECRWMIYRWK